MNSALRRALSFAACLLATVFATAVFAATKKAGAGSGSMGGTGEVILVAQVALLLLTGRGLGELMQRIGQPAIIGQLLAGLILGPSLFGWIWPAAHQLIFPSSAEQKNLITGIADMGVMMLLLLTGMETDLKLVRKVGAPAFAITGAGVAVPFICGFALGQFLPDTLLPDPTHRLVASLFIGTALSISSIKIVAMVVRDMNFMRRNVGQIIVASSIMEDTTGWVIVSITLGIAGAGITFFPLAKTIIGTLVFLVLSYTIGRRLVFWLIRWVNDTFLSEYAVITAILIVMCVMAMITQAIGVNTVLGAFVAGALVGESPILSQQIEDELRGFITAFMMPIFFGMSGLSADLTILKSPQLALLTAGLVGVASIGKFGGAFTGGMISGLRPAESLAVGCAMNARGSTEVIVATIGLTMGALSQNLYTMIVTMAVITTMTMPPMLRWALHRLPMDKEEKTRLEKEEIDAKGFVSQFERLLIAADESANGKLASRIAGFIAGQRGMPITVLEIGKKKPQKNEEAAALKEVATEAAKDGHRVVKHKEGDRPEKVEVSARVEKMVDVAVSREAAKGYDVLFIGLGKLNDAEGAFSKDVNRAAKGFEGPLVIVGAGDDVDIVESKSLNILVPVNGTEASRRGAEVALSLSSAKNISVTAVHVADRAAGSRTKRAYRPSTRSKKEKAVLEDVVLLAKRYGLSDIRSAVRSDVAPDEAVLGEAKNCKAALIVIGTTRRVGEELALGQTVSCLLQKWKGAIVIVVS